jgi:large subunit ribosomal protein L23
MASTTKSSRDVILAPVWTEKSAAQMEDNHYTFRVADAAHKTQVRQAVEEIWGVRVTDVRIMNARPRRARRSRVQGYRPGYKKAIVTLAPGDKITLFEGMS